MKNQGRFCFALFCFFSQMREIIAHLYSERSDPIETGKLTMEKLTISLLLSTKRKEFQCPNARIGFVINKAWIMYP